MKACVFGAGAIGGHLAVRLAQAGWDMSVVARSAHLEAIRRDGLRLRTKDGEVAVRLRATERAADLGVQDVVLVTTKTTALVGIAEDLSRLVGPDTAVAFVINGLPWWYLARIEPDPQAWSEPVGRVIAAMSRAVAPENCIGGVAYSANRVVEPGVIFNANSDSAEFLFGAVTDRMEYRCEALTAALSSAGLPSRRQSPFAPVIWKKLLLNVVTGPVGALTGMTSKRLLTDPMLAPTVVAASGEAEALAAACGITGVAPDLAKLAAGIADHKSSMLQDYELGRRPEIDTLLGALCDLARMKGRPTPTLNLLYALARARAAALGLYP